MNQKHRGRPQRRRPTRRAGQRMTAVAVAALALIIVALAAYIVKWYVDLGRIRADGARYREMYPAAATEAPWATQADAPAAEPTETPAPEPAETPTPEPTEAPTPEPTETPAPAPTFEPMPTAPDVPLAADAAATPSGAPTSEPTDPPTAEPSPAPTEAPTPEPTAYNEALQTFAAAESPVPNLALPTFAAAESPAPTAEAPAAEDRPLPTPNADTLVFALPTPPPVQESFAELLAHNPETVGFLQIDSELSLPVVQRENDNEYYLTHTFDGAEAIEGALFMDGMNRLVPEDDCLIVYGHNMKNDTMFGRLSAYGDVDYLKQHSIVRFDTLYENRLYVPFAAFAASTAPGDRRYFDVRQFVFDAGEFEKFVLKLQSRSVFRAPIDVREGDRLLLLVTCDYRNREGRFILALRQLRPDESEANVWAQMMGAAEK